MSSLHIIWAVNPHEPNDGALQQRARKVLRRVFATRPGCIIEPVYVFRAAPSLSGEFAPRWRGELQAVAEAKLRSFVKQAHIPRVAAPKVLVSISSSYRRAADTLARYARISGADLIVSQTHARTGLGRAVLGSFAETLLLQSQTPTLLVNPRTHVRKELERILFPTDFSKCAASQFRTVLDMATDYDAKIVLFHALESEKEAFLFESALGPAPILDDPPANLVDRVTRHAKKWISIAHAHGVEVDFVLRERTRTPAQAILETATKRGIDLIAMQSNTSALTAALLGSTTRQVIRQAPCPVWVLKPRPRLVPSPAAQRTAARPNRPVAERNFTLP
jgi:nucleotide-binding universal stress UspA family protein